MNLLAIVVLTGLLLLPAKTQAQETGQKPPREYIAFPCEYHPWQIQYSLGLSLTVLPRTIVEEEIRQAPMLDFQTRYGLPLNFSLTARLGTNVITNLASLGAQWSYSFGRLSLSVGDAQAFWYGFSSFDGFDVTAQGWLNFPHISAGYDFDEFALSLKGEADFVTFQQTVAGTSQVQSNRNLLSGGSLTLAIEQPFWKQQQFLIGLKLHYSKRMYQSWLAFSTFDDRLLYPELFLGVSL